MSLSRPQKTTWLMIVFAFTMLPLLLMIVSVAGRHPEAIGDTAPFPVLLLICPLALLGAVYWATGRVRQDLPTQKFQSETIVALGFSELCTLLAFVTAMQTGNGLPLVIAGAANILVNLTLILPAGLRYWASNERSA